MKVLSGLALLLLAALPACVPASDHARDVAAGLESQERLTLGSVQREIRVGMTGAEVASALGSPNIVTNDGSRGETWVYDRMATQHVYSRSSGGVNALFLAGVGGSSGAAQTSQRTLTVIIHFDPNARVRDFSYRSSSF
jgi:outer membrane protein assembly factor BamE (lipoprotein component of BamABCDE complex)